MDEVLTPDSSRFWPADKYKPGQSQPSFDKQYLRGKLFQKRAISLRSSLPAIDWLAQHGLKGKTDIEIPEDVIQKTVLKYREACERLVGKKWDEMLASSFR